MSDTARARIWYELKYAKTNSICLERYTNRVRKINRWVNWGIVIIATVGSAAYGWKPIGTLVASVMVAVVTFLKNTVPIFAQSDEELVKLDGLLAFYNKYFCDVELIWIPYDNDKLSEQKALDELHRIKTVEAEKMPEMNRYVRSLSSSEKQEIETKVDNYLEEIYDGRE